MKGRGPYFSDATVAMKSSLCRGKKSKNQIDDDLILNTCPSVGVERRQRKAKKKKRISRFRRAIICVSTGTREDAAEQASADAHGAGPGMTGGGNGWIQKQQRKRKEAQHGRTVTLILTWSTGICDALFFCPLRCAAKHNKTKQGDEKTYPSSPSS